MKLAKEVGKDLRTLPSACRSAAIRLLELGFDIVDVKQNLVKFAELESKLYDRWYRKMVRAIQDWRIDPETYAYELAHRLDEKSVSPEHVITLVNRRLQKLKEGGHRPSRMLEQVKKHAAQYMAERKKFQKYAVPFILDLNYEGLYKRVGEHTAEIRRVEEDKLFQLQTIHHLRNKQDDCLELMLPAADRRFPEDLLPIFLRMTKLPMNRLFLSTAFLIRKATWLLSWKIRWWSSNSVSAILPMFWPIRSRTSF